jgi:phosphoribosylformylglycinamidine cyclo-ligase
MDGIVDGSRIEPGDALVGLASTGLHSNGFTLARKVFRSDLEMEYGTGVADFGRTLGEELLEPTGMYVVPAVEMLEQLDVRGLAHITGDGLLNLRRMNREIGFDIEFVPRPQAVFSLIQRGGRVATAEMYRVFNMGVGFCVVIPEGDVDGVTRIAREHGYDAWRLGTAVASPERRIRVLPLGLTGAGDHFEER